MPAPKTTLWPIDDHTRAKHEILRRYLAAWLPIMTTTNERIVYLDGFAGPGEYKGGEPGSPIISIDTFLDHKYAPLRDREVLFIFIEQKHDRCEHLRHLLAQRALPPKANYEVFEGNFDETLTGLLDELESHQLRIAPTFAFIDPFGYSHTPLEIIRRLMSHPKCEVLITFMYEEINRFLDADYTHKMAQYDGLFGTTAWNAITRTARTSEERSVKLHNLYRDQLSKVARIRYIRSFCMRNKHNARDYFLFFGTNNLLGMRRMKGAMCKVDPTYTYEFSDFTNPDQPYLLSHLDDYVLQQMLINHFKGQTARVEDVEEYVIAETPFYKFITEALRPLETAGKITVLSSDPRRRKGTFAAGKTRIHFL